MTKELTDTYHEHRDLSNNEGIRQARLKKLSTLINVIIGDEPLSAFCRRAGLSKGNMSNLTRGRGSIPRVDTLKKIYMANPYTYVKLNDLFEAAGYPTIKDLEPSIPIENLVRQTIQKSKQMPPPGKYSAQHVILDYLEKSNIEQFSLNYGPSKYCTVNIPGQDSMYIISSLSTDIKTSSVDLEKALKQIEELKSSDQTIKESAIYLITNSISLFSIIKGYFKNTFRVIYTEDNFTMSEAW